VAVGVKPGRAFGTGFRNAAATDARKSSFGFEADGVAVGVEDGAACGVEVGAGAALVSE
jgi:hypothetical protein